MSMTEPDSELGRKAEALVRESHRPEGGEGRFPSHPLWRRLRELGTELWLDSGDIEEISDVWTREFSGLTTNNSLLNKEIQKGTYDALIERTAEMLDAYPLLTEEDRRLEVAFVLNTHHALRLVERFDAHVSVEEHTVLAGDLAAAINYARRFHALYPTRFYVKMPFSSASLLATRRVSDENVLVNHTLGFSARQNYLITRIGRPLFVNVFMGRLNSVVQANGLGSGEGVGEKAVLASQAVVKSLRQTMGLKTRQIAASLRSGDQVARLAGVDVITLPPRVAREFIDSGIEPGDLRDRTGEPVDLGVDDAAAAERIGLPALWDVDERVVRCADALEQERLATFTPVRLEGFFQRHDCADLLVRWSDQDVALSAEEGKIPSLDHWRARLESGEIGLDSLMNLAGWNSFRADQEAMDEHARQIMAGAHR
ncbi:MAG: transaldolase [Planctomycetes bacterium]|nr:transaldolase [Planctomycetota bacterium]